MDIAGLEDDPDFWDMDIEEHCRDGLPDKPKKSKGASKPMLESPNPEPLVVPTKPKAPARKPMLESPKPEAPPTKPKASARKPADRRLEQLESLHERLSVATNLKLSQGHRLKLDSAAELKRKRKPMPKFNIDFAEIKDLETSGTKGYDEVELGDDDDDMPEAFEIMRTLSSPAGARTPPSETTYSSSDDVDSLIRAVPLDDIEGSEPRRLESSQKKRKSPPPPVRKRNRTLSISPPKKRSCYETSHSALQSKRIDVCFNLSTILFIHRYFSQRNVRFQEPSPPEVIDECEERLFLPNLSDSDPETTQNLDARLELVYSNRASNVDDDDYSLGSDEYLEVELATPNLTTSNSTPSNELEDDTPLKLTMFTYTETNDKMRMGKDELAEDLTNTTEINDPEDEFAELDAWLNSAAVDII
ncbi:hypothetical protein DXG03_000836 [Asterophora parasitica]|uniref:Uncharacterized protein n=1 Tax=Asterophora parasitica TaxID=117018 RepID=A0A9P7GCX4_9AGAR|nr:hypothetical protein DXG03_000836 [Asterophora parasitica]